MKLYMAEITLPSVFTEEFTSLIPQQRMIVDALMSKKIIVQYCVSLERGMLWTVIQGKNEMEVMNVISQFPIEKYIKVQLSELMFYNTMSQLPVLSWN